MNFYSWDFNVAQKSLKLYTLARFEPTISCSGGGDNVHYIHQAAWAKSFLLRFRDVVLYR
jgi:hypothetical protein